MILTIVKEVVESIVKEVVESKLVELINAFNNNNRGYKGNK